MAPVEASCASAAVRRRQKERRRARQCDIGLPDIYELKVSGESSDGGHSWYSTCWVRKSVRGKVCFEMRSELGKAGFEDSSNEVRGSQFSAEVGNFLLYELLNLMQDLVFGEAGGVEDQGVGRGCEGRRCASTIAAVAFA